MPVPPKTEKRVQIIISKVRDYMDIRFAHAARVNPNIRHIYEDVRWQQLMQLRIILEATKPFGPDRYYVADILCEDNIPRKKALFNPVDQNSIMNEIINIKEEEGKKKRAGQLPISDMRTFYTALNLFLERIVELIQIWIWWDLADASDIVMFEHQVHIIKQIQPRDLDAPLLEHYQKVMRLPAADIRKEAVLHLEFKKLEEILVGFTERRSGEEGHQMIVKRDLKEDKTFSEPYDYKHFQLSKMQAIVDAIRQTLPAKA